MFDKISKRLGLRFEYLEARTPGEARRALAAKAKRGRCDALVANGPLGDMSKVLLAHGLSEKIPVLATDPRLAKGGALLTVHADLGENFWDQELGMIDKMLSGMSPARIPVEKPKRLLLSINEKTAKRLGLTIPDALRLSAQLF